MNPQIEDIDTIRSENIPNCKDAIYVLRTTQQHHIQLNLMADQKAHILIGASLVFATFSQSNFRSEIPSVSLIILGIAVAISSVASVLVIMPRFRAKKSNSEVSNLLFFGSYTQLTQNDFVEQLEGHLKDINIAHKLMMKDIYQLGSVLKRKYVFLKFSYLVLTLGILSAAIHFAYLYLKTFF